MNVTATETKKTVKSTFSIRSLLIDLENESHISGKIQIF